MGAFLTAPQDLWLDLEDSVGLLLSATPDRGRVHLTPDRPGPEAPTPNWARKHLVQGRVDTVNQPPYERILHLDVVKQDRVGSVSTCRLIAEVTGRHANVILVTLPGGKVAAALRHVTGGMSRHRQIVPGRPYCPPPPLGRLDPLTVTGSQLMRSPAAEEEDRVRGLAKSVAGMDPLSAAEVLAQAGTSLAGPLDPGQADRLAACVSRFMGAPPFGHGARIVTTGRHRATVCAFQESHAGFSELATHDTVSKAIEALDRRPDDRSGPAPGGTLAAEVSRLLKAARKKARRIETDLAEAQQATRFEQLGNLLMANLGAVPSRAFQVDLEDLFGGGGETVTIPLDPGRLPRDNALDYMKKGRKGKRAEPILTQRLKEVVARCEALEGWLEKLKSATSPDEVNRAEGQMRKEKLLGPRRSEQAGKPRSSRQPGPRPRRYRTSDGWTVLVGRNNNENDSLTKSSAADDVFLHAQGCPGSHVILKREGRPDMPSRETLRQAAALAAYWSKARNSKKVPVVYTEVRHVRKPRSAPPGLVTLRNEKALMATPEELPRVTEGSA